MNLLTRFECGSKVISITYFDYFELFFSPSVLSILFKNGWQFVYVYVSSQILSCLSLDFH